MEDVSMLFNQLGELLGDDVIEGIVAVVESYEGPVDLQDVQQSLEEVSSKFAVLSQAEKDRFTRQLCETVKRRDGDETSDQDPSNTDAGESGSGSGLETLQELCPGIPQDFLAHVLKREVGDVEAAAIWLTGQGNLQREVERWKAAQQAAAQKQVAAERAERAARKALLNRFAFQPASNNAPKHPKHRGKGGRPTLDVGSPEPASKVRYRDGMPVANKGEKYIVQTVKEDWDGGSSGKIYTKGKRGKGVA